MTLIALVHWLQSLAISQTQRSALGKCMVLGTQRQISRLAELQISKSIPIPFGTSSWTPCHSLQWGLFFLLPTLKKPLVASFQSFLSGSLVLPEQILATCKRTNISLPLLLLTLIPPFPSLAFLPSSDSGLFLSLLLVITLNVPSVYVTSLLFSDLLHQMCLSAFFDLL